jgi:hypothetical protein
MSNFISNLFGKQPKNPVVVQQPRQVSGVNAELSADAVREKYAKMQRATMVSQMTEANVKRTKLGAG